MRAKFCSDDCKTAFHYKNTIIRVKAWNAANKERKKQSNAEWHKSKLNDPKHKAKRRYHWANRRARKLQATPKWLTKEQMQQIKQFYIDCPIGFEVDHIVPLKGNNVSGLHAPWNLQWLPDIVNRMKSNRVTDGY